MKDSTIEEILYEVCCNGHSSCDSSCPVFCANNQKVPNKLKTTEGCDCFKNGKLMRKFIEAKGL